MQNYQETSHDYGEFSERGIAFCQYCIALFPVDFKPTIPTKATKDITESINDVAGKFGGSVFSLTVKGDRVIVTIQVNPRYSIDQLVRRIKTEIDYKVAKKYKLPIRDQTMWEPVYFASTIGSADESEIDSNIFG